MPYVIENLVQYDMTEQEAAILEGFGFVFRNADENPDPDQRETTALVWETLGLEGDRAYDLFDVILRRGEHAVPAPAKHTYACSLVFYGDDRLEVFESRIIEALETEGIDFDPMTVTVECTTTDGEV